MSSPNPVAEPATPTDPQPVRQRHGRHGWLALRIALVLAAAVALGWWLLFAPIAVTALTVATGSVTAEVLGTGTLEARTSALVGPKLAGLIVNIAADQGDRVKAGDLLFQLEDSDTRQQVAMAEAEVAAATATLDRLRAAQQRAAAVLAQAKTNHARTMELGASNLVAQQELDRAVEALAIAEADVSIAGTAILEGNKRLTAAERFVEYQRARLDDTTVEAPFDALVVRRDRGPGDVVTAGSAVMQLVSTDEMWITAWVDETELARLAEGQPARVVFRSEPGVAYAGAVARVGRETDRETRELVVDVRVAKLPATWAVGQRAEAYIEVARKDAVTVLPAALLQVRGNETGVMLDVGGTATWRAIEVGLRGRETVEVTAGLSPGDVVVTPADAGADSLREGRRIRRP